MNLKRIKKELEIQVVKITDDPVRQKHLVTNALNIYEQEKEHTNDPGRINARLTELIKRMRS